MVWMFLISCILLRLMLFRCLMKGLMKVVLVFVVRMVCVVLKYSVMLIMWFFELSIL